MKVVCDVCGTEIYSDGKEGGKFYTGFCNSHRTGSFKEELFLKAIEKYQPATAMEISLEIGTGVGATNRILDQLEQDHRIIKGVGYQHRKRRTTVRVEIHILAKNRYKFFGIQKSEKYDKIMF